MKHNLIVTTHAAKRYLGRIQHRELPYSDADIAVARRKVKRAVTNDGKALKELVSAGSVKKQKLRYVQTPDFVALIENDKVITLYTDELYNNTVRYMRASKDLKQKGGPSKTRGATT